MRGVPSLVVAALTGSVVLLLLSASVQGQAERVILYVPKNSPTPVCAPLPRNYVWSVVGSGVPPTDYHHQQQTQGGRAGCFSMVGSPIEVELVGIPVAVVATLPPFVFPTTTTTTVVPTASTSTSASTTTASSTTSATTNAVVSEAGNATATTAVVVGNTTTAGNGTASATTAATTPSSSAAGGQRRRRRSVDEEGEGGEVEKEEEKEEEEETDEKNSRVHKMLRLGRRNRRVQKKKRPTRKPLLRQLRKRQRVLLRKGGKKDSSSSSSPLSREDLEILNGAVSEVVEHHRSCPRSEKQKKQQRRRSQKARRERRRRIQRRAKRAAEDLKAIAKSFPSVVVVSSGPLAAAAPSVSSWRATPGGRRGAEALRRLVRAAVGKKSLTGRSGDAAAARGFSRWWLRRPLVWRAAADLVLRNVTGEWISTLSSVRPASKLRPKNLVATAEAVFSSSRPSFFEIGAGAAADGNSSSSSSDLPRSGGGAFPLGSPSNVTWWEILRSALEGSPWWARVEDDGEGGDAKEDGEGKEEEEEKEEEKEKEDQEWETSSLQRLYYGWYSAASAGSGSGGSLLGVSPLAQLRKMSAEEGGEEGGEGEGEGEDRDEDDSGEETGEDEDEEEEEGEGEEDDESTTVPKGGNGKRRKGGRGRRAGVEGEEDEEDSEEEKNEEEDDDEETAGNPTESGKGKDSEKEEEDDDVGGGDDVEGEEEEEEEDDEEDAEGEPGRRRGGRKGNKGSKGGAAGRRRQSRRRRNRRDGGRRRWSPVDGAAPPPGKWRLDRHCVVTVDCGPEKAPRELPREKSPTKNKKKKRSRRSVWSNYSPDAPPTVRTVKLLVLPKNPVGEPVLSVTNSTGEQHQHHGEDARGRPLCVSSATCSVSGVTAGPLMGRCDPKTGAGCELVTVAVGDPWGGPNGTEEGLTVSLRRHPHHFGCVVWNELGMKEVHVKDPCVEAAMKRKEEEEKREEEDYYGYNTTTAAASSPVSSTPDATTAAPCPVDEADLAYWRHCTIGLGVVTGFLAVALLAVALKWFTSRGTVGGASMNGVWVNHAVSSL